MGLAAMNYPILGTARSDLLEAEIKDIKVVSTASEVQEMLNKASPEKRKSLEAAIHTGNLFIPQLFSGNAYDTSSENEDWTNETEPLINLDRKEWEEQKAMHIRTIQLGNMFSSLFEKKVAYTTRLTCPHFSLISIQQNTENTTLLYRTSSVGTLVNYQGDLFDFNLEGAGAMYDIRIELSTFTSLVTKVIPKDDWLTESYTGSVAFMKRFLGDHRTAHVNKEREAEMVKSYQSTIQKIEQSASKICR